MPNSLFQRLKVRQEVPASYDVQSSISIYCILKIIDVDSHCGRFEASVGMRALDDTTLPVGSKLTIKLSDLGTEDRQGVFYTCQVDAVRKKGEISVHSIQVLEKTVPDYHRAHPRVSLETDAKRAPGIEFKTNNISSGGLQLTYGAKLTSAVLNRAMSVHLNLAGVLLPVECIPRYIQYNWWTQEHTVGTCFNNLDPSHAELINTFIESYLDDHPAEDTAHFSIEPPEPPVDMSHKKATIDTESGRIRFL